MFKYFLVLTLMLSNARLLAAELGHSKAKKGGTFLYNLGSGPTTLNPFSSMDAYATVVQKEVLESLLERNPETYKWSPRLAESWKVSKDGKKYTFKLRKGIFWHDGAPLTVADVKFSFDAILDVETYKTAHRKPYFEGIKAAKIIDKSTIVFTVKNTYFANFREIANMLIVPMHIYKNPAKKQRKKLNKTLIGTGPYILEKYNKGKNIILKRNKKWWGLKVSAFKNRYNFDKFLMKFVKDSTISMTMLEKGNLDFIGLGADDYVKKTSGKKWGKEVFKVKIKNKSAKGYAFIGFNLKDPLFKSKKIRKALHLLVNRELMNKKFLYGLTKLATGPLYRQSEYADPTVKPIPFNPALALKILRSEGWKDSDGDGILDKMIQGKKKKFEFTILEPSNFFNKYLTVFKEDAKKIGVVVHIKNIEWTTFVKLLEERKFSAVRLGWSGGKIEWDPKQIWHSDSRSKSGSNFIGYSNLKVDKLIDEARLILDHKKRVKLLRQVYKMIADDVPYIFFFNADYNYYAHRKRIRKIKDSLTYAVGRDYWWIEK